MKEESKLAIKMTSYRRDIGQANCFDILLNKQQIYFSHFAYISIERRYTSFITNFLRHFLSATMNDIIAR
jgi:hypothetical protein